MSASRGGAAGPATDLVLVAQFFPPETGAGARRTGALAEALRERFRLRVVTLEPGYPDAALFTRADWEAADRTGGLAITRRPAFRPHDASLVRRALREIGMSVSLVSAARRGRPRVIVVSTPSMFLAPLGWLAARVSGARFVWDLRDLTWRYAMESAPPGGRSRGILGALEGLMVWLLRRSDLVIAATSGLADVVREQGVPEASLVTVTNGVARAFLDRFAGECAPAGNPRPRVTYVGLMGYNHGIGILLDVARAMPDVDVCLVGDGPERAGIESRVRDEAISNVTLRGYVTDADELARTYRSSDVLVNHTRGTPTLDRIVYPAKTFEYFATGRPVVYAATGYAADLMRDRGLAVVVPPDDPQALAGGIRAVLADPGRAAQRSRAARQFVESGYCREDQMRALAGEIARRFGNA